MSITSDNTPMHLQTTIEMITTQSLTLSTLCTNASIYISSFHPVLSDTITLLAKYIKTYWSIEAALRKDFTFSLKYICSHFILDSY